MAETYSDVVREHPETAALIADIQEQNQRDLVNALPTWEDLDKAKQNAYWSGYEAGREAERDAIYARIFGSNHFFGTDSES